MISHKSLTALPSESDLSHIKQESAITLEILRQSSPRNWVSKNSWPDAPRSRLDISGKCHAYSRVTIIFERKTLKCYYI